MTTGGLRDRLLKDSFFAQVQQALDVLGWFETGRSHKLVTLLDQPNHWDVPCEPNTIAVNFLGSEISEWEVGSLLTSDIHVGIIEIFAENDSLGTHLSNDLRDWLRGRLQAATGLTFPIYDYQQGATPPIIGYMDVNNVSALRNVTVNEQVWMRHWFRVRCEIRDVYAAAVASEFPYPAIDLFPEVVLYPGG
jgi:hypothetical protein